jgi:predicted PurR-regulated permease PerM
VRQSNSFWKENVNLFIFVFILILIFFLLYTFRSELLPFGVGLVLVSIIQPIVVIVSNKLPKKGKFSEPLRLIITGIIMVLILLAIAGLFFYFIVNIASAFSSLLNNAPQFFNDAARFIGDRLKDIEHLLPFKVDFDQLTANLGTMAGDMLKGFFGSAFTFIPTTFGLVLGFLTMPIFIFFVLKDAISIRHGFYDGLPRRFIKHAGDINLIIVKILGQYIRALLFSGIIIGILVTTGLWLAGIPFNLAVALGVFAGFCEWIPPIGIWISLVLGVIITLAVAPTQFIWVLIVYVLVILIEAAAVSSRFHGKYLKINPGIMMVLMVIGSTIAGLWGMVLINPFAQTILEIYKYVRDTMQGETEDNHT